MMSVCVRVCICLHSTNKYVWVCVKISKIKYFPFYCSIKQPSTHFSTCVFVSVIAFGTGNLLKSDARLYTFTESFFILLNFSFFGIKITK